MSRDFYDITYNNRNNKIHPHDTLLVLVNLRVINTVVITNSIVCIIVKIFW
jgi:hypothetical protein